MPTIPTAKQAIECFITCQTLTEMYLPIVLVRFDRRTNQIYILAGEETKILIDRDGKRKIL